MLTDNDPMPFGKYVGYHMKDVPAKYLDWLIGQTWINEWPDVEAYIIKNKDTIDKEIDEEHFKG